MYTTPLSGIGDTAPGLRKRELPASQAGEVVLQPLSQQDAPEAVPSSQQRQELPFPEDAVQVSPEGAALSAKGGPETQQQESLKAANPEDNRMKAIREAIQAAEKNSTSVRFTVDKDNGELIVTVVNKETGEVVHEVPPAEIRELRKALADMKGFLVKKAT